MKQQKVLMIETQEWQQGLLLETQKQQKTLLFELEEQQKEKFKQEAEEWKNKMEDIKALIQEQKQIQEYTTAELGLLQDELDKQITWMSTKHLKKNSQCLVKYLKWAICR